MTNYEKIKGMTPEELAELLCELSRCEFCATRGYCRHLHTGYIDWLKEEAEGSET